MCRGTRAGRNELVHQIPTFPAPHSHFKLILKISGVHSAGCDTGGASVRVSPSRQNGTSQNRDISVQTLSPAGCGQGKGSVISPMWDRAPNQAVPAPLPEHSPCWGQLGHRTLPWMCSKAGKGLQRGEPAPAWAPAREIPIPGSAGLSPPQGWC